MIGNPAPASSVIHTSVAYRKSPHINTVQPQHRQQRRIASCRSTAEKFEYLVHVQRMRQFMRCAVTPVPIIKVPGNDQRRCGRHQALDALPQARQLQAASARGQGEMHAYAMQRIFPAGHCDLAMQQAASFKAMGRNVLVVPMCNRIS